MRLPAWRRLPLDSPDAPSAAGEIVVANWGGDAVDAYANGWGVPFTEDTGVEVIIDGAGPLERQDQGDGR